MGIALREQRDTVGRREVDLPLVVAPEEPCVGGEERGVLGMACT